jgi:1,4-alpha-glucan branching enzyme
MTGRQRPTGKSPARATTTAPIAAAQGGPEAGNGPEVEPWIHSGVGAILGSQHDDPHRLLGPHQEGSRWTVRVLNPRAETATLLLPDGASVAMPRIDDRGLFSVTVPDEPAAYRMRFTAGSATWEAEDPYRFLPTLGELDLHLFGEGQHHQIWQRLGARAIEHMGVAGVAFAVWAPNALGVRLAGDFNLWDLRLQPLRRLGSSGVWELFVPGAHEGERYKYEVHGSDGVFTMRADPYARAAEAPPATASAVTEPHHSWQDAEWLERRQAVDPYSRPMSIYELHAGSWRRNADGGYQSYRQLAEQLPAYCRDMGFTHVEFMPLAEHPFTGSWGYQVTGYYAPTARFGSPDDLRVLIDELHRHGIGVFVDWVPAHFPRDPWALARFDGTALYEHLDPRRGYQPDWDTYMFNFSRNEVRDFMTSNARYWVEDFHVDGLRVDAVAAMLYLDYSRKPGQWIPNPFGGRENLEAISLLREVTESLQSDHKGVLVVAEESTAWPGVTQRAERGGLGFSLKWNMGWMHDTLDYFSVDPVFRRYHHNKLTFGLWYAWSERFVLPLSHDEVVHGKGSLLGKMHGDAWQRHANLRALYAWMWAHPGRKLLFMGGELAQEREWNHDRALDWHLLDDPMHAGVQRLVRDLNTLYRAEPALHERDDQPDGFSWIDAGNADQNVLTFFRRDKHGRPGIACIANLSPAVRERFRVGLPLPGRWREILNTDATEYGGSGVGNLGAVDAEPYSWNGQPNSVFMTLPPLAVTWLQAPAD